MTKKTRSALHFSETEYEQLLHRMKHQKEQCISSDVATIVDEKSKGKSLAPSHSSSINTQIEASDPDATKASLLIDVERKTKKRLGVKEDPILTSILQTPFFTEYSPKHLTLYFPSLRLFSLNELFALLQYRKYIVFKYKKSIHDLVHKALGSIPKEHRPFFSQPCHITLYRSGAKRIDRDNFESMFKALIDGLKKTPKNTYGVIADDNPDILFSDTKIQSIGEPSIAIRIDVINPAPKILTNTSALTLFNSPPSSSLNYNPVQSSNTKKVKKTAK